MHALLLSVWLAAPEAPVQSPAPARVVITAELVCLHCEFGEGEECAACLKLDAKTPVVLQGKLADALLKNRFDEKAYVITGTLGVSKQKRPVLTVAEAHVLGAADKDKAPPRGEVRVIGTGACAACDLKVCDACGLAVINGATPILLDGKLAEKHMHDGEAKPRTTATGKLAVDKNGVLRLNATALDVQKK